MSVKFDQKEDLRLRMADLEKKLAESEEERCKLEKTCNVLMKAFREEEKMHYKALNQKYEKFLEDCAVRKRRNNIILRSLCRIEDRSRALFAKTERLRLLKDRYITYLNVSDYKRGETYSSSSWRSLPFSSPRYVQWTTPLATHLKTERLRDAVRDLLEGNRSPELLPGDLNGDGNVENFEEEKSEEKAGRQESRKGSCVNEFKGIPHRGGNERSPRIGGLLYSADSRDFDSNDPKADVVSKQIKNEKLAWNQIMPGSHDSDSDKPEINFSEEKVIGYHEKSEKFKKGLPSEGNHFTRGNADERHDPSEGKIREKAYAQESGKVSVTKENKSNDAPFLRSNYNWSRSPNLTTFDEKKQEEESKGEEPEIGEPGHPDIVSDASPKNSKPLPKGLDGVDYQNETYPESYYEQPVHHNHASIASDVILEEDETEQELDEEEKNFAPDDDDFRETLPVKESSRRSPEHGAAGEPQWETDTSRRTDEASKGHAVGGQIVDEVRSRGSESGKSSEENRSERLSGKSGKNKATVRSNLIHLLDSDSESFQIEHGGAVSGNEDSDFDFSFHQN